MGIALSNVSSNVKQQAEGGAVSEVYRLVDLHGGGQLVELMRSNLNNRHLSREFEERIQERIKKELPKLLYNGGMGKLVPIEELVMMRNNARPNRKLKVPKKKKITFGNVDLERAVINGAGAAKVTKNGLPAGGANLPGAKYGFREVCWRLDERGAVGETILHLCILNASSTHADLAKQLLKVFPKLINDIYQSEEYYGESVLHMAIVNEDPAMVKFLLDHGANYHERFHGNMVTPDDQKATRRDNIRYECVDVARKTNYEGNAYFGEYPLCFAATLGQEESVRLLMAKGADPNRQEMNGNTVMHMMVIHNKPAMFDLIKDHRGRMDIKNRQGLTPFTLAAKLARKDMYEHILQTTRITKWTYAGVQCAAYPLAEFDTINPNNGHINVHSVLHLIVYGDRAEHLDMLDGLVESLLKRKWNTFVRNRYIRQFVAFAMYFCIFLTAFLLRPGKDQYPVQTMEILNSIHGNGTNGTAPRPVTRVERCFLLRARTVDDYVRLTCEGLVIACSVVYLCLEVREIFYQGLQIAISTLRSAPAKALFLLSCCLVLVMIPCRASCAVKLEDHLTVLTILGTSPYLLFFCRGIKMIGPFVVMLYDMIRGDLLRFFCIYLVFVVGFSQAFYIIFQTVSESTISHSFHDPVEAGITVFVMSLGTFLDIHDELVTNECYDAIAQIVFLVYLVLANILLINMLIAMMGNTYNLINETQQVSVV